MTGLITIFRAFVLLALATVLVSWSGAPSNAQTLPKPGDAEQVETETKAQAEIDAESGSADPGASTGADEAPEQISLPERLLDASLPLQEFEWELLPLTEEELAELAGITGDALKFATQVVVAQKREIAGIDPASSTPGSLEQAKETMVQLVEDQAQDMRRYRLVVNALEAKGGDPELVAKLRAYQVALIADQARLADRTSILHHARKWLLSWDGGAKVLLYLGVLAGSLVALILLARIVRGWSNLMLKRAKVSRLLKAFLEHVFFWMTIIVGFLMVLATLGVDIGPLVALIGGASFIIAFAMQDTLSNFAAGLMIMIYQPFDEGDFVSVAGIAGEVRAVSVVATTIRTPDNQVIIIPNSRVWGDVITNVTGSPVRRVDLVFGIGYEEDLQKTQQVLEAVVQQHPDVLRKPAPMIRVSALRDSCVEFMVRPWVRVENYWDVYWDLTRDVKIAFDAEGISIPYPQRELTIRSSKQDPDIPGSTAPDAQG